jgi:sirohydrochlorin ferrochelatase
MDELATPSPKAQPARTTRAKTGLLLIAHGSRHAEANDDLHHLVEQLRQRSKYSIIEAAFLELTTPTIEQAGTRCVQQGARRVLMLPYFLSAGVHVRHDLTDMRKLLAEHYPEVEFLLGEPLGRHPLLLDILGERARELEEAARSGHLQCD